jgi:hypothetical protein
MSTKLFASLPVLWMISVFFGILPAHALSVDVVTIDGDRNIDFGQLKSVRSPEHSEPNVYNRQVKLTIDNTTSSRYLVSQIFKDEPRNPKAGPFDMNMIKCYVTVRDGSGVARIPHPQSVRRGEQDLYLSDATGADAELIVYYSMTIPPNQSAGRYDTSITYKVSTI